MRFRRDREWNEGAAKALVGYVVANGAQHVGEPAQQDEPEGPTYTERLLEAKRRAKKK